MKNNLKDLLTKVKTILIILLVDMMNVIKKEIHLGGRLLEKLGPSASLNLGMGRTEKPSMTFRLVHNQVAPCPTIKGV